MEDIKKFENFLDRMQGLLDNAKRQGHIIVRVEDLENTFPELKESEMQKLADKVEPKFKVGDKIQYLKGCGTIMTIEKIENGEYIFGNNLGHTPIESGNKWYLVEQKSAWSEEDDYNLQCMIAKVTSDIQKGNVGRNNELIDWLKSLEDRVQPKQEWSEKDEYYINDLIKYFSQNEKLENTKEDIVIWLKSLKSQNEC